MNDTDCAHLFISLFCGFESYVLLNRFTAAPILSNSVEYFSLSVCQVEHPAARHDASLFPHRQRVFALRRNLPAHAHV